MDFLEVDSDLPGWARNLWKPYRYKVVKSGRGAGKSWTFAEALLLQGIDQEHRIVCGRETQASLVESVHQLLADTIRRKNMGSFYTVQKDSIFGPNGTKFLFKGLRHDPAAIKSLEGATRLWLEEGDSISKETWQVVKPTFFRRDDSEIWVSYNPKLLTDETHQMFFVREPPTGSWCYHTSWRENKWFPDGLRIEMEDDKLASMDTYRHVWEGEPRSTVLGAIYQEELLEARENGRITKVSLDRSQPVHTFWDLGFGDDTCVIFAQAMRNGDYRIIDCLSDSGKTIQWYMVQLQQRGYVYGEHWLPHDAVDAIIHRKLGGGDPSRSIEMLMRASGLKVRIAPKFNVNPTGLNAVRTMFPNLWFDAEKCKDLLHSLAMYQWAPSKLNLLTGEKMPVHEPLHDQHSHWADALRTLATSIRPPAKELPKPGTYIPHQSRSGDGWMA